MITWWAIFPEDWRDGEETERKAQSASIRRFTRMIHMFLIPELVGDELHRKEGVCGKYLLAAVCKYCT